MQHPFAISVVFVFHRARFLSALMATAAPETTCLRTQDKLDALLKDYNEKVFQYPDMEAQLAQMFNQTFLPGTEADPRCKCGKHIRGHDSEAVHHSGPPQPAGANSFRLSAQIRRAARFTGFRARVYTIAVRHGAYDEGVRYSETPITSNADLHVDLYFPNEDRAVACRAELLTLVEQYGGEEPMTSVTQDQHRCNVLTNKSNMRKDDSPDRSAWDDDDAVVDDPESVSSSVFHNELTAEDIKRETLCEYTTFTAGNQKALWAHLKAKKICRKTKRGGVDERSDSANRLVMNWALHSMFDDNLTNDGKVPTLTVYAEDVKAEPTDGGYVKLRLRVVFKRSEDLAVYGKILRGPVAQLNTRECNVSVEKKKEDEQRFRDYLKSRHDKVMLMW